MKRLSKHAPYLLRGLCRVAPLAAVMLCIAPAGAADKKDKNPCQLDGNIEHVISIQFDNVHLTRDNPNVLSDLEQMPHLKSFLENNGTLLDKHYTVLISHTTAGVTSSLTGLYPDRMGVTVSNSYDYYDPATGVPTFTSAFKYWTAPVAAPVDNRPNMITTGGKNTPAPWVTYTRAGCDVGNISVANTVLENSTSVAFKAISDLFAATAAGATKIDLFSNTGFNAGDTVVIDQGAKQEIRTLVSFASFNWTLSAPLTFAHAAGVEVWENPMTPAGDLTATFGAGSPEWTEGLNSQESVFGSAPYTLATTDFVGIAVHCAKTSSSVCANKPYAKPDVLPDEPGQYLGFQALFGAKYVNPAINHNLPSVNDLNGAVIADSFGQPGFPGFDSMPAATTLGYVAQMQESGIPVTYAYISDVHDNHAGGGAYGPGEQGYVDALAAYDAAFAKFFARLAADGITTKNTLFIFTADENDHYAGEQAQGCNGVPTVCTYNTVASSPKHGRYDVTTGGATPFKVPVPWPPAGTNGPLVGEMGYSMNWLIGNTIDGAPYDISFDSAPSFYIYNQPQAVDSSGHIVLNSTVRDFEKAVVNLKAFDPYIDSTQLTPVGRYFVDGPTLKALHMVNADPQRTMSFTMFAVPDYYFQTNSPCSGSSKGCLSDSFAWIHGDYSEDIGKTWLGMAGPGIAHGGLDYSTWTDHTDIVPTVNALVGLTADYQSDGRVITQILTPAAAKGGNSTSFTDLGDVYKQLNAPYGDFAHSLIVASTNGIKADDGTYLVTEQKIQQLTSQRDTLVQQMKDLLDGSAVGHREQLIRQGADLLAAAKALAGL